MKIFKVTLDKRWKEVVFAAAGFGPNLLMVLMMAYFTDAVMPQGLVADIGFWSYGGSAIVAVAIFPVLWTIGRIFDGVIDVPLAHLTDTLRNKTGRRDISLLVSFLPMVISFVLCWIPVFGRGADLSTGAQIGNSIWIFFWSIVFFATYTLALITFYGSLSDVCENQTQRSRVSAYKSVFDTISYALVYAAIPAIFKAINIPIWQVALYMSPLMLTILIPILLQRRQDKNEVEKKEVENVPIGTSIALTIKSKPFMKWTLVNCVAFFGLQMFLVAQNALISGIMNLGAGYAAILNTCAFAPVPLMLWLFGKVRRKKGVRFAFQTCLITFGLALFAFALGSQYIWGDQLMPKLIIGAIGGVIGSWGIGGFFMMPYLIPTVIASVEEEVTNKNHSAMYFAVQALFTSVVGAIASSLIYNYLKLWTVPSSVAPGGEWKTGVSLVPLIVAVACFAGFFLCFLMPKKYSAKVIYNDIKSSSEKELRHLGKKKEVIQNQLSKEIAEVNASSISNVEKKVLIEELQRKADIKLAKVSLEMTKAEKIVNFKFDESKSSANEEVTTIYERSNVLANVFLYFLSGFIFNIIDACMQVKKLKILGKKLSGLQMLLFVLSFFMPFLSIYTNLVVASRLEEAAKERGVAVKLNKPVIVITSAFLPLFTNFVALTMFDKGFNKIIDEAN